MHHDTPFTPAFRRLEFLAILLSAVLYACCSPAIWEAGAWNLPLALGGLVVADLVSGIAHWGFDRWGSVETPLLGPNVIRTFREHHTDPTGITRHSFVEANGGPAFGAIGLLSIGLAVGGCTTAVVAWLSLALSLTNVVHAWAHGGAPAPVRWLQRAGLLLSPEHHQLHHTSPHDQAYCITTGWWNPLLDTLRAWERVERLITAGTGVAPYRA